MTKGFSGVLVLIGVLVIVAVASGAYYLQSKEGSLHFGTQKSQTSTPPITSEISPPTQTEDETANWKTYANIKHNYEVKIPLNYETKENSLDFVTFESPLNKLEIIVLLDTKKGYIAELFDLKVGEEAELNAVSNTELFIKYKRLDDETINGERFLVVYNPDAYGGERQVLYLKKNNAIYAIGTTYKDTEQLKNFRLFYSTFRFN